VCWNLYRVCESDEAFSRTLRSCGRYENVVGIKCEPVTKQVNYNYEGCHRWHYDANWTTCGREVYDCNDPFGPSSYYGCDNDPARTTSVTRTLNALYHDFAAEVDKTYSKTCTWDFN